MAPSSNVHWSDRMLYTEEPFTIDWLGNDFNLSSVHVNGTGQTDLVLEGETTSEGPNYTASGTLDFRVLEMLLDASNNISKTRKSNVPLAV